MNDAPIFIVGCPRSGTGLLRDLLRSHPRLSLPPESHFIPSFYRAWGDPGSDREARALGGRILALRRVRAWEAALEPPAFDGCRSFAEIVDRIYGEVARREGKPRWGDKTPHYVTEIPTLLRLFPRAKIVHIYRDGRDVALSFLRLPYRPSNVYVAAKTWRRYVGAGRRAGARAGRSYAEVCYEELLRDPRATMDRVCEFVEERFTEDVLRPDLGARLMWSPGRDAGFPGSIAATPEIARDNRAKWKASMGVADRALFESVAGDRLAELGYEVEGLAQRIPRRERIRHSVDDIAGGALHGLRSPRRSAQTFLDGREAALRSRLRRPLAP